MPRRDDDYDDDEPRARRGRDGDDELPRRKRRPLDDDDDDLPAKKKSSTPLILGIVGGILLLCCGGGGFAVYWFFNRVSEAAQGSIETRNNLTEIGIAMHNHADRNNAFPTNTYSRDGKPLLSWRVHLLPYLGQDNLYRQFKLDEPWDSANNRRLLDQMPLVYATAQERRGSKMIGNRTHIRGFSNKGALFERMPGLANANGKRIADITDGLSNTILAVEAADAVEWTKPDDLDASPGSPFPRLGVNPSIDKVFVLFCDGGVKLIKKSNPETQWRASIGINDGIVVMLD